MCSSTPNGLAWWWIASNTKTFTDSCGDREVSARRYPRHPPVGHRSDLGQTPIVADALAHDLVKATQQDIHEILIVANGVIQRGTARADNGCADHAQRTIWSDGKSAGVDRVREVPVRGQPAGSLARGDRYDRSASARHRETSYEVEPLMSPPPSIVAENRTFPRRSTSKPNGPPAFDGVVR